MDVIKECTTCVVGMVNTAPAARLRHSVLLRHGKFAAMETHLACVRQVKMPKGNAPASSTGAATKELLATACNLFGHKLLDSFILFQLFFTAAETIPNTASESIGTAYHGRGHRPGCGGGP